jgi:cardiolipin synthase
VTDQPVAARKFLTVPNVITVVRLSLLPVYLWLLFGKDELVAAGWLLAVLGITDYFDGFIARRFNQVSEFGKIIDPVADRILVATAVISTMAVHAVPVWFGLATLVREIVVSLAVVLIASLGGARIDVLWIGKCGAFGLMVSYPMFLGATDDGWLGNFFFYGAWTSGLIGLVLSWMALVSYVPPALEAFKRGRKGRAEHHE